MKNFLKRLFCKHQYEKISWYEKYDECTPCTLRYSIRIYRCVKCRKEIEVDGRYDKYVQW